MTNDAGETELFLCHNCKSCLCCCFYHLLFFLFTFDQFLVKIN